MLPPAEESDRGEKEPPEYPDPLTSMFIIMTGEHEIPEIEARKIWGDIWRAWKKSTLCYDFYQHQRWVTVDGWKYAIKELIRRGTIPSSIRLLETIGIDAEVNGAKQTKPVKKADIGNVPYKSSPTPGYVSPRIHDPGPRIPADEALKILTGKKRGVS